MQGQLSPKRVPLFVLVLLLVSALRAVGAAPVVSYLWGEIKKPEGLNVGVKLEEGDVIETGADAKVVVKYVWPSQYPGYNCVRLDAFGGGKSYRVHGGGTGGRCDVKVAPDAPSRQPGQAFEVTDTRFGDAGFDDPSKPAAVARSHAARPAFGGLVTDPNRVQSYFGKVTELKASEIRIRGKRSADERSFKVPSAVLLVGANQLAELKGREVRLDFKQSGFLGGEAVRIEVRTTVQAGPDLVALAWSGTSCKRGSSQLTVTVKNQGGVGASLSQVTVEFSPGGSFTQELYGPGTGGTLPAGSAWDVSFPGAPPSSCFNPDCHFRITVDSGRAVVETNEANNQKNGRCSG